MKYFFTDYNCWFMSFLYNLAIGCIWYGLEFIQFGTLQWYRICDNCIFFIYYILIAWLIHKNNIK